MNETIHIAIIDDDVAVLDALRAYVLAVKDRSYPAEEHTFVG